MDNASNKGSTDKPPSAIRLTVPATVILERRTITRPFWSMPSWYLHTVAIGEHVSAAAHGDSKTAIDVGKSDKGDLFAWGGFDITLYKDASERYWHSLIGDQPLVYVICKDDADDIEDADSAALAFKPVTVTVDYDAASAASETDLPVLSLPMPGDLYRHMEDFVLTHYKPEPFKKRKRRDWSGQSDNTRQGKNKNAADGSLDHKGSL